jgi:hypothetical protein
MAKPCYLIFLFFLIELAASQTVQDRFNPLFDAFYREKMASSVTRPFISRPAVNKCRLTNRGQSSDSAKRIHDMSTFMLNFQVQNRQKVNLNSEYCPFKSIACDSTTRYRTFDGSCNNLRNPLLGR